MSRALRVSLALAISVLIASIALAQGSAHDEWIEEPGANPLEAKGDPGHSYLDPGSVHRGDDGLVYFNESS